MNTNKAIKMRIRQTVKSVVIKHRILAKAAAEILFIKLCSCREKINPEICPSSHERYDFFAYILQDWK